MQQTQQLQLNTLPQESAIKNNLFRNNPKRKYIIVGVMCIILITVTLYFFSINTLHHSLPKLQSSPQIKSKLTRKNTSNLYTSEPPVQQGTGHFIPAIYESTTQDLSNGKTSLQLLQGLGANFIFRGTFQWGKGSLKVSDLNKLQNNIEQLKQEIPSLQYEGGIGAQYFEPGSSWTNGSPISTSDFNSMIGRNKSGSLLVFPNSSGYVPDLASPLYRLYLIEWSERQIDAGVDGMFFDDPFYYAKYRVNTLHANAVSTYQEYASYLYNGPDGVTKTLRDYAASKNQAFFVTINAGRCDSLLSFYSTFPFTIQPNDYISCSFELKDFDPSTSPTLSVVENFGSIKQTTQKIMQKNVPIITFIDWPTEMNMFKTLTTKQQITVLENIYSTTRAEGIYFAFPILVKGQNYDSIANGTYNTLTRLARK